MSKSSTVTVREAPVEQVASAVAGGLRVHGETLHVQTGERIEVIDLTDRIVTLYNQGGGVGEKQPATGKTAPSAKPAAAPKPATAPTPPPAAPKK